MTVVGRDNLIRLFPNFKDDVAENGIDLRVGNVQVIDVNTEISGCIDDIKYKPNYIDIPTTYLSDYDSYCYKLLPNTFYFITVDRDIHIPDGYTQIYLIRSTFARCGLQLVSSVGDNDFNGTLMMSIVNNSTLPVYVGCNERLIQAVTFKNDGTASKYDGVYQNNKFYE